MAPRNGESELRTPRKRTQAPAAAEPARLPRLVRAHGGRRGDPGRALLPLPRAHRRQGPSPPACRTPASPPGRSGADPTPALGPGGRSAPAPCGRRRAPHDPCTCWSAARAGPAPLGYLGGHRGGLGRASFACCALRRLNPSELSDLSSGASGASRADIGRCEAHGAPPRLLRQPAGPTPPLGSLPARLAPWRAVQAPTTRPIPPPAGSAGLVGGSSGWSDMGGHAPLTQPRWQWLVSTPPGVLGGHWGGVAPVCGGCVDLRGKKITSVGGSWAESVALTSHPDLSQIGQTPLAVIKPSWF